MARYRKNISKDSVARSPSVGSIPRPSLWDMPPEPCPRSVPPSVALADPHLAGVTRNCYRLLKTWKSLHDFLVTDAALSIVVPGQPYTMEWAALPSDKACGKIIEAQQGRLLMFTSNQRVSTEIHRCHHPAQVITGVSWAIDCLLIGGFQNDSRNPGSCECWIS